MNWRLVLSIFLFPVLAQSQEKWTLESCIRYAIDNNSNLKLSELNIASADINVKESKARRLPNLNGSVNSGINFGRNIDPTSNDFITENILYSNYGLGSNVNLFQGGALSNTIKQNAKIKEATILDHQQNINDVSLIVANAYLQVLLSDERIQIAKTNINNINLQLSQMRKLIQAGGRAESDAIEIESQLARAEQALIGAENASELSWFQLRQSMRMNSEKKFEIEKISNEQLEKVIIENYSYEQLYSHAEQNQAAVKAAKVRLESSKISEKIARSSYYPSISLNANYGSRYSDAAITPTSYSLKKQSVPGIYIDGKSAVFEQTVPSIATSKVTSFSDQFDQFLGYGLGLSLNIPIYNNNATRANIARAKIQTKSNAIQLDLRKESLSQDITQALINVRAAKKELEASQKSLNAASTSLDKTKKRFEIGSASSFEMNQAQNNFQNAELNKIIAKYDLIFKYKILDYYAGKQIKL
ncbi:MAG: TolC family protein [Saprospiraceae bacterium]|jgi:outer membrane protein